MRINKLWIVLLFFVDLTVSLFSLTPGSEPEDFPYNITIYSEETGLPYFDMGRVLQDKEGMLYFTAWGRGLYSYDGHTWTNYTLENAGLMDNVLIDFAYDGEHTLFLGSMREGVSALDLKSGKVRDLISFKDSGDELSYLFYYKDMLYISTFNQGMIYYDMKKKETLRLPFTGRNSSDWRWNSVYIIYLDSRERIWLGTRKGLVLVTSPGEYTLYPFSEDENDPVHQIEERQDGSLWVFSQHRLGILDEKEKKVVFPGNIVPAFHERLQTSRSTAYGTFVEDSRGRMLLLTDRGILVHDPGTGKSFELNQENGRLPNNYADSLFKDREGSIWVTTYEGMVKIRESAFINIMTPGGYKTGELNILDTFIPHFSSNTPGEMWLFSLDSQFALKYEDFHFREIDLSSRSFLAGKKIERIFTYNGKSCFKIQYEELYYNYDWDQDRFILLAPSMLSKTWHHNGKEYTYFFRFFGEKGIEIKEPGDARGKRIRFLNENLSLISFPWIDLYFPDENKDDFLVIVNPLDNNPDFSFYIDLDKDRQISAFLSREIGEKFSISWLQVWRIVPDHQGGLWILLSNPRGRIFRLEKGDLKDYSAILGTSNRLIESIKVDSRGRLLIATGTSGLLVYDGENLFTYNHSEGLANDRLAGGVCVDEEDRIYTLSHSAFSFLDESKLVQGKFNLRIYKIEDSRGHPYFFEHAGELALAPEIRAVKLFVTSGSYLAEQEYTYSFQLEGEGTASFGKENSFHFAVRGPGVRHLKVQAKDHLGQIVSKEFTLRFKPFWFETLPVRLLEIGLIVALFFFIQRWGVKRRTGLLEKEARELEEKVILRTREIRQLQDKLVQAARSAGKAELAGEVLHTTGNILNSIGTEIQFIGSILKQNTLGNLQKAMPLLKKAKERLMILGILEQKEEILFNYLEELSVVLAGERQDLLLGVDRSFKYVEELLRVIQSQRRYLLSSPHMEPLDLGQIVREVEQYFRADFQSRKVRFLFSTPGRFMIRGHSAKLFHILISLLNNALEAVESPGLEEPLIEMEIKKTGEGTELVIRDNGEGIPSENLSRVFRFGFTTKKDGQGFNLHTCANFMAEMKGALKIESPGTGHGTVVRLIFTREGYERAF